MTLIGKQSKDAVYMTDEGSAFDKDVLFNTAAFKRWSEIIENESEVPNIQVYSKPTIKPSKEESHIRLTLVDSKEGTKEYVATQTLMQFLSRHNKFVEFFTTRADGTKVGLSLEWVRRDEIYLRGHLTDKEIEKLNESADKSYIKLAMTGEPQEIDVTEVMKERM